MKKDLFLILLAFLLMNMQAACSSESDEDKGIGTPGDYENNKDNESSTIMNITVNNKVLDVSLVDNAATRALKERLQDGPVSYTSSNYGDFETVGYIGFSLPANNTNITTQAGDVILYQGSQICIFYGSNSWSYTRIGRITNASQQELRALLSSGEVNIMLSLNGNNGGIMGETVARF